MFLLCVCNVVNHPVCFNYLQDAKSALKYATKVIFSILFYHLARSVYIFFQPKNTSCFCKFAVFGAYRGIWIVLKPSTSTIETISYNYDLTTILVLFFFTSFEQHSSRLLTVFYDTFATKFLLINGFSWISWKNMDTLLATTANQRQYTRKKIWAIS